LEFEAQGPRFYSPGRSEAQARDLGSHLSASRNRVTKSPDTKVGMPIYQERVSGPDFTNPIDTDPIDTDSTSAGREPGVTPPAPSNTPTILALLGLLAPH
jgi:hypothetical protein